MAKKFFVSIAICDIISNYEATVEAENEQQAEDIVRGMYDAGDYDNAEVSIPDYSNSDLTNDKEAVYIEQIESED